LKDAANYAGRLSMKRTFGKELLYQLLVASLTAITFPLLISVIAMPEAGLVQSYLFFLVLSAPVFYTGGVVCSAVIEWIKQHRLPTIRPGSTASYLFSLVAYGVVGAAVMHLYLATVLGNLQIHTSRDVYGLLLIGAGASLYMYHVSLALQYAKSPLSLK
jgi:hypothetical protein